MASSSSFLLFPLQNSNASFCNNFAKMNMAEGRTGKSRVLLVLVLTGTKCRYLWETSCLSLSRPTGNHSSQAHRSSGDHEEWSGFMTSLRLVTAVSWMRCSHLRPVTTGRGFGPPTLEEEGGSLGQCGHGCSLTGARDLTSEKWWTGLHGLWTKALDGWWTVNFVDSGELEEFPGSLRC